MNIKPGTLLRTKRCIRLFNASSLDVKSINYWSYIEINSNKFLVFISESILNKQIELCFLYNCRLRYIVINDSPNFEKIFELK